MALTNALERLELFYRSTPYLSFRRLDSDFFCRVEFIMIFQFVRYSIDEGSNLPMFRWACSSNLLGLATIWLGLRLEPTALAQKSMIWILLRKIQDPNVPGGRGLMMGQELVPHGSAASVRDFVGDVITSLVDAAVHCVVVSYMRQGQFWRQQKRFIEVEHRSPN
uniref:Uncharacterized protein n=1 Tax=Grammatophora oceanica TaxID=210454 RepID=A0A6U5N7I2_9STRA|mmetsp:Transcript_4322/g.5962  ORF Transcript_4322/g.5962 Transcript_4322/m.5962 type:complete len:165 (+) Transcript_4322:682-1176(+)